MHHKAAGALKRKCERISPEGKYAQMSDEEFEYEYQKVLRGYRRKNLLQTIALTLIFFVGTFAVAIVVDINSTGFVGFVFFCGFILFLICVIALNWLNRANTSAELEDHFLGPNQA